MPNPLTNKQRRWLKAHAHHLGPVVTVGQAGLTEAVLKELDVALTAHEFIKVRISVGDREVRDAVVHAMADRSGAEVVVRIGNVAALFRANPNRKQPIRLPPV